MRKVILIVVVLSAVYLISLRNHPDKNNSEKKTSEKVVVEPLRDQKKMIVNKERIIEPERKVAQTRQAPTEGDVLSVYPKNKMTFFSIPFYVLEGIYASTVDIPQVKKIAKFQNFNVYEGENNQQLKIIYSPEKKKYGVFTGEVTVVGGGERVLEILENNSMEIIYRNEISEKIIFQVKERENLDFLSEIKNTDGVKKILPDLKFSRLKTIN